MKKIVDIRRARDQITDAMMEIPPEEGHLGHERGVESLTLPQRSVPLPSDERNITPTSPKPLIPHSSEPHTSTSRTQPNWHSSSVDSLRPVNNASQASPVHRGAAVPAYSHRGRGLSLFYWLMPRDNIDERRSECRNDFKTLLLGIAQTRTFCHYTQQSLSPLGSPA